MLEAPTIWNVVFCDPEPLDRSRATWQDRAVYRVLAWLRPGFRHCFLFRATDRGYLVINPHAARIDVVEAGAGSGQDAFLAQTGHDDYGRFVDWMQDNGLCRVVSVVEDKPEHAALRPWFSCVETVKHVIGLRPPWWVVTPWQLYRWLERRE